MQHPNAYIVAILLSLCYSTTTTAHHGKDFLLTNTVHLPERGDVFLISGQDFIKEEHDEIEWEPTFFYGLFDWASVELHAHLEKEEGESLQYESIAPAVKIRLTPRESAFSAGFAIEYEIARDDDEHDVFEFTGIAGFEQHDWQLTVNLLGEDEQGDNENAQWGYALAGRQSLNDGHALGLEIAGSFESGGDTELLGGYYFEKSERFSLLVGIGTSLETGADWTLRTSFVWKISQ